MGWSTREVANLAGTTVNTVRHYHRVGLLDVPDRASNGYKQYQVRHLVRLLQIRRLRDLGVPLERIEHVGGDSDPSSQALAAIDADLALSIERLQRARAEISAIMQGSSATDVPSGFEDVAARLSAPERALMLIYSQLYDEDAMADVRKMLETHRDEVTAAFDALAPDADETQRRQLAEKYAPKVARSLAEYPWLSDPTEHLSQSPEIAQKALFQSIVALYNPAQIDVIARASVIAQELLPEMAEGRHE
ncbi:MerR family transcriptional regulator [Microbacterium caowuchunii]|uniref:MerR family transcriptional regulator n=1 Tax=Microbacterium caowuchunii TaxID=2614638 RepID=UPI001248E153|nr:MerR family transcriptional regulator [Microbacterium caowuchunii]QEV99785.1 MerR family transcriptional regulator [Microbacterium caowuchunii]